jgi:uncharacterized membrane protein YgcG
VITLPTPLRPLRYRVRSRALLATLVVFLSLSLGAGVPAGARSDFVQDGAQLFSAATVSSLDNTIADFNAQTGKEIVVVTVPSLDGQTPQAAAEKTFAQQQVNGVLIFMAKAEKAQGIVPDRAAAAFFPAGAIASIRQAMRGYFRSGDFDTGITTGVNLVLAQYRSHERTTGGSALQHRYAPANRQSVGGGMSLFWLILILIAGFLIIRAVFRAMAGPRRMPPGYGAPGPGGPGPGGPGYGPGYGGGGYGGGGGFFSGLLGGLGGAFLGNELFGRQNTNYVDSSNAGMVPGGDVGGQSDAGWQSDAGQADMGNASFGDYGSSGGGFGGGGDSGGGGGDFGGGGGGGDSGGGW